MSPLNTELLQGTLDLLILKTLALAPQHGYGISLRIQQISKDALQSAPGLSLPRSAPARTSRLGCGRVGRIGKQPPRKILQADGGRPPPT